MSKTPSKTDDALNLQRASFKSAPLKEETIGVVEESLQDGLEYLQGWRLYMLSASLFLSLFLVNFEISIVSTSLVAITDDLQGFSQGSWIVTAYLLTYTGFLIIWAKWSDIFGRKLLMMISVAFFVVFSGACGASQTINQLIIFRAIQGIGGSGVYSIAVVIIFEMVPSSKYAFYTSLVAALFAVSLLTGPLFGGVINKQTTWRWVFLLNVPSGALALLSLFVCLPNNFPHHVKSAINHDTNSRRIYGKILERVDFLGTTLLLAASVLLVAALQEAGTRYAWSSPMVVTSLILSGFSWIAFFGWQWQISRRDRSMEAVFPWTFVKNRVWMGMLLLTFLTGVPFTVAVIQIPQKFQVVNDTSPLQAGLRLLPFAFSSPFASGVSASVTSKFKVPPIYILFIGAIFQSIGFGLLSSVTTDGHFFRVQYLFEVIAGLGVGTNIGTLILMTPYAVDKKDQAVAMGAIVQFRVMGGALGLAIVTCVMNSWTKSALSPLLSSNQLTSVLQTTAAINAIEPAALQTAVRTLLGHGYILQMRIMIGFAVAQFPATLLVWQTKQIRIT